MKKLLINILSIRKHLLKSGKGFKNKMKCYSLIGKFENHLENYPNISEKAIRAYMTKHKDDILFLLPKNSTGDSIKEKLSIL